jgi:ribulose-bisphosphate carboxylase large chain
MALESEMRNSEVEELFREGTLHQNWRNIKSVFPVSSGGLHPGIVPDVLNLLGNNCVLQLGGGIHGHPKGTKEGAKALRQAIDAVMNHKSLEDYAKKPSNKALALALKHFGHTHPV